MERRTFIAAGPVAIARPILTGEILNAAPADPHRGWLGEWRRIIANLNNSIGDLDEADPAWVEKGVLEKLMSTTPASTIDGVLAQLEFAVTEESGFEVRETVPENLDGHLFGNAVQTLRGLV